MRHRIYLLRLKGGEIMNESVHDLQAVNSGLPEAHTIHCTLYGLIEAISEEVEPGGERLIAPFQI
jgi:hypothetical protein